MAVMVWCQSCKKVIWAYDHQPKVDLRGICNMLKLPCPKCGDEGNFDGWASDKPLAQVREYAEAKGVRIYDAWSAMHFIADEYQMEWDPSGNLRWFPKDPE